MYRSPSLQYHTSDVELSDSIKHIETQKEKRPLGQREGPARAMTETTKTHVILLACGSFNPITKGHIQMFGFPGGSVVKNPLTNAGDMGLTPGPGGSHRLRNN